MIYFAQPRNGGPIRIGFTGDTNFRKKSLGTWLPGGVEYIHEIEGGLLGEALLHLCFNPIRVERDWFRSCEQIWKFIISAKERRPSWLPSLEGGAPTLNIEEIRDEFGGIEEASKALGYSRTEMFLQAAKWQTSGGVALYARVEFSRLARSGSLPSYIADLHDFRSNFLEAAQ